MCTEEYAEKEKEKGLRVIEQMVGQNPSGGRSNVILWDRDI